MKISLEGLSLIKKFEGCKLEAYKCSAGVWTIGYGHTAGVKEGDVCTQEEAEKLLRGDIFKFEEYVQDSVKVDLDQSQFDALVAWTFNLGPGNLRSSTMLKKLNNGRSRTPENLCTLLILIAAISIKSVRLSVSMSPLI